MTKPLKLICRDEEDLKILSSCLQDSIVPLKEIAFLEKDQSFAMLVQRYMWECEDEFLRINAAVLFKGINAYEINDIDEKLDVLSLLALESDAEGITLYFSGGGQIKLFSKEIQVKLDDVEPSWKVQHRPKHHS